MAGIAFSRPSRTYDVQRMEPVANLPMLFVAVDLAEGAEAIIGSGLIGKVIGAVRRAPTRPAPSG